MYKQKPSLAIVYVTRFIIIPRFGSDLRNDTARCLHHRQHNFDAHASSTVVHAENAIKISQNTCTYFTQQFRTINIIYFTKASRKIFFTTVNVISGTLLSTLVRFKKQIL